MLEVLDTGAVPEVRNVSSQEVHVATAECFRVKHLQNRANMKLAFDKKDVT